jgi:hypothetical protein
MERERGENAIFSPATALICEQKFRRAARPLRALDNLQGGYRRPQIYGHQNVAGHCLSLCHIHFYHVARASERRSLFIGRARWQAAEHAKWAGRGIAA